MTWCFDIPYACVLSVPTNLKYYYYYSIKSQVIDGFVKMNAILCIVNKNKLV